MRYFIISCTSKEVVIPRQGDGVDKVWVALEYAVKYSNQAIKLHKTEISFFLSDIQAGQDDPKKISTT
jgi:hypothetical protein